MTGPALPAGVVPADRALRSVLTSAAAALGVPGCENALAVPAGRGVGIAPKGELEFPVRAAAD